MSRDAIRAILGGPVAEVASGGGHGHSPPMLSDRVLFIDAEAIVVDKPAGLPVDAPRDGAVAVENHLESLCFTFQRWPTIVHRLDRDTSGCLLLARNQRAHRRYAGAFEAGTVRKRYLAVLDGIPEADEGEILMPLGKVSTREQGWRMVPDAKGKPAATRWRMIASRDGRALVLFAPSTGRTHQLRVHAASGIGLPIVGDPVYGRARKALPAQAQNMMLHAWTIALPRDGKPAIEATAPLPPLFAGWDAPDHGRFRSAADAR